MTTPATLIPRLADGVAIYHPTPAVVRLRSAPFQRRGLHRWLATLLRRPERIELELDDIGAWVVTRFDGRSVSMLAADLAAHLKLTQREAEVALGDFLRQLVGRRLVVLEALAP